MTRWHSPGGVPGENVGEYYFRRAQGGVGLIITEGVNIDHPGASGYDDVPAMFGIAALAGWRKIVQRVHQADAAIAAQLWHVGAFRRPGVGPQPSVTGFGPTELRENGELLVEALSPASIREIVRSYGRAAENAASVGFDAVEIHGAHGYLLDQFLWSGSNPRSDAYGGSVVNRVRFAAEVVEEIRSRIPAGMPIIYRFSQWKMHDYSARIAEHGDELEDILRPLADAGVDIFHPSTRRFCEPAFAGSPLSLAAWTKRLTGRPVIAVGSIGLDRPHQSRALGGHERAEAAIANLDPVMAGLEAGDFDIAAIGRGLLADPLWAQKVARGALRDLKPLEPRHLKELI